MKFFKNIKLAKKIGLLSASFFIFLTMIGIAGVMQISAVNSMVTELYDSRLVPIVYLQDIKSDIEYIRAADNKIMDAMDDDASKKSIQEDIQAHIVTINDRLSKYKNDAAYKELFDSLDKFITANDTFLKNYGVGTSRSKTDFGGNTQQAGPPTIMVNLDTTKANVITYFDKNIDVQVTSAKQTYDQSKGVYSTTKIGLISLIVICGIITLILSLIIIKAVVAPVKKVTEKLKEISHSNGDLTKRIGYESKDEIGELSSSFDLFIDKLHGIIKEVALSANVISSSSEQLRIATRTTAQSLDNISSTIEEITSSASDTAAMTEETSAHTTDSVRLTEATSIATKNTSNNSKFILEHVPNK